jgi:predicted Zn finger-like uncharacterized protein
MCALSVLCRAAGPIAKHRIPPQDQAVGFVMRIICPACETAYDVPDSALAPGRMLRCARCRSEWTPVPAEDVAEQSTEETTPVAAPATPPPNTKETPPVRVAARVAAPRPAGPRVSVIVGWSLSFLLLGSLGYSAIRWRHPIERVWPPSSRAYALFGYR